MSKTAKSQPDTPTLLVGTVYDGESAAAIRACNDYLRLGPDRSLRGLVGQYSQTPRDLAPTQSFGTLQRWSQDFRWKDRAMNFDVREEALVDVARRRSLSRGLAQDFERVEALKRVEALLREHIFAEGPPKGKEVRATCPECGEPITIRTADTVRAFPNLWTHDAKIVGRGESASAWTWKGSTRHC